jgi:hypothetical protein
MKIEVHNYNQMIAESDIPHPASVACIPPFAWVYGNTDDGIESAVDDEQNKQTSQSVKVHSKLTE